MNTPVCQLARSDRDPEDLFFEDQLIWKHMTIEELNENLLGNDTASGPDGLTAFGINNCPRALLYKFLNCFFLANIPCFHTFSKTIFLPKVDGAATPDKLRPISMASVLCRLFYKVLAT